MGPRFLLTLSLVFLSIFCFSQPVQPIENAESNFLEYYKISYLSQETGLSVSAENNLLLYDTIVNWLGTPYKFAGNCEKGIDCSGFVNMLCDRVYGKRLGARNSAEIFSIVQRINRDELKEGDLVFFRIYRKKVSHIGLYLGENKFVHASTSKGVIISDLDELYYKKHFAGAGRIKDDLAGMDENN